MKTFIKINTTQNGPTLIDPSVITSIYTKNTWSGIRGSYSNKRYFELNLPVKASGSHTPVEFTGTATGHASNKVIDSTASFTSTVQIGDIVENIDTTTQSFVTAIDSDTQLTINQNGLWSPHVNYKVIKGSVLQDTSADFINDVGLQVGDIILIGNTKAVVDALTTTTLTLGRVDYNTGVPTGDQFGGEWVYNLIFSSSWSLPYFNYSVEKAIKDAINKVQMFEVPNSVVEVITENPLPSWNYL